jgi:hypothetical protein
VRTGGPIATIATGLAVAILTISSANAASQGFSGWAAVIISGDNEAAHVDKSTEAFDNARRDLGRALEHRGFSAANLAEFSVEPNRHPDTRPGPARLVDIAAGLRRLANQAPDGCLVYLTSHGSPDGAVLGEHLLSPRALARLVGGACGRRPTIVVISACFSGVFVPALAGPHRLILTAARRDRSSFGCGESDEYPFFDGCVLENLSASADFIDLAGRTRRCVAKRENFEHMSPPSEPQLSDGARFHSPAFSPPA